MLGLVGCGAADRGDVDAANASIRRRLNRPDQRRDHRVSSHEAESFRCGTRRGQPPKHGIDRDQQVRPSMTRSQHVPGPQDRRRNAGRLNERFTLASSRDIGLHHRRRVSDAHVHEVPRIGLLRRGSGGADRGEIDATEFRCLRRTGVRRAHQVNHCGIRRDARDKCRSVERIPDTGSALRGSLVSEPGRTSA